MRLLRGSLAALGALAALAGCGGQAAPPAGGTFQAFASDFNGFHAWPSAAATPASTLPPFDAGALVSTGDAGAGVDGGTIHKLDETVYWNAPPPPGSATFPVHTILVKETNQADPTARQVFAMVKRGGDFNPTGAVDWEWFELANQPDGTVSILWRGYGPPSGTTDIYGGDPAVCNHCHGIAVANDYVWSSALQLSRP